MAFIADIAGCHYASCIYKITGEAIGDITVIASPNAVVNAFYYKSLCELSFLAEEIGETEDAEYYRIKAEEFKFLYQRIFVSNKTGTGSPIWHWLYSFPPVTDQMIEDGYADFARRFIPIMDEYQKLGIRYGLEVHPTEIAFDTYSARKALDALNNHPAFGFNYDPSHMGYQGVDYVDFIYQFSDRIFHVHMKDVYWSDTPKQIGVFGGHSTFGDSRRFWNFRSMGRGRICFEEIIRALNDIGYQGPLSVEWEDSAMDREHGARESCQFVKQVDFQPSGHAFDAFFEKK